MQLPDVDHVPEFCFCWRHVRIRHLSTEGCVASCKSKDATRRKCFKPSAQIPNSLLNVTSLAHGNFLCPARFPSAVVTIETIDAKRHSLETPKFHESKLNISSKKGLLHIQYSSSSLCVLSRIRPFKRVVAVDDRLITLWNNRNAVFNARNRDIRPCLFSEIVSKIRSKSKYLLWVEPRSSAVPCYREHCEPRAYPFLNTSGGGL